MDFTGYQTDGFFDELFDADEKPRSSAAKLIERIEALPKGDVLRRQKAAEAALRQLGITFAVYGERRGTERIFPFDIVPRIVEPKDWTRIEAGLRQRSRR